MARLPPAPLLTARLPLYNVPENAKAVILLCSRGGAHLDQMAWIEGYVTPSHRPDNILHLWTILDYALQFISYFS